MRNNPKRNTKMIPIFVALDTPSYSIAEDLLYKLRDTVDIKIGLEFFIANGLESCRTIRNKGASRERKLFLDLKFHDIPNTVAGAVKSAMEIEPDFLTIHCDGAEILEAAVAAADQAYAIGLKRPKLLGVTVLTSIGGDNPITLDEQFANRINQSHIAGFDGIICPPSRIGFAKKCYPDMFLMVPGIRMEGSDSHDQKNITTPKQAMDDGADALVIGREITKSEDPLKAVMAIKASMEA